jgi:alkylated DNA repair dioxygenase AlkB
MAAPTLQWQPSLLSGDEPDVRPAIAGIERLHLSDSAWVDHAPAVVTGADTLFAEVLATAPWASRTRPMYDQVVVEPRLTTRRWADPPPVVRRLGQVLSGHYGTDLRSISANLYRSGEDSVAWHGDRIGRARAETVVALVTLGTARRFLLRPKGGGPSLRLHPAPGDLLVMGGTCQRTWEHCVPKCRDAGPRISIMFREVVDR